MILSKFRSYNFSFQRCYLSKYSIDEGKSICLLQRLDLRAPYWDLNITPIGEECSTTYLGRRSILRPEEDNLKGHL